MKLISLKQRDNRVRFATPIAEPRRTLFIVDLQLF
jgi:hypothetical protein